MEEGTVVMEDVELTTYSTDGVAVIIVLMSVVFSWRLGL